ncbi:MAG: adenine deaminase C-terminal domain-containing protein [Sporolactobacillus sp.]
MELSIQDLKLVSERQRLIDVLMDPSLYADTVLQNGNVINVITREIYTADVAISGKYILMVGDCSFLIGEKTKVYDMSGNYISPGFIDSHMHFESAMLTISEFSKLSIPTGTTCLVTDPHEIGNVLGPQGVKAMCEEAALMPQHVHSRVPSFIPDSPGLETPGYAITSKDVPEMLNYPTVSGIGEIQGVAAAPYVYQYNPAVFRDTIVSAVYSKSMGKKVDGNAADLYGKDLAAHIIAGGTEISCHETTSKAEAISKLRNGVYMLMREGSTQKNMAECIRTVLEEGMDSRRVILATDDMLAQDLATTGHMNDSVRRTIREGVDPVEAIQMVTINAATWQGFSDIGVLAPGKLADITVIKGDLADMLIGEVFIGGELVAKDGNMLIDIPAYTYPDSVKHTVKLDPIVPEQLMIKSSAKRATVRSIGLIPDQNLTEALEATLDVANGIVQPSLATDYLPIAVVGRHGQKTVGKSFVNGFGMQRGAIAETVSHDTHNIIVIGTNYQDMAVAVNRLITIQGGVVLANEGEVLNELPLRVAGLITDELDAGALTKKMEDLTHCAQQQLGVKVHAPFMHLAFLSLSTSPKWKITDKGVVDANHYCIVPTIKEEEM